MSRHDSELTDEQWNKIRPLLPKARASSAGGRRRVGYVLTAATQVQANVAHSVVPMSSAAEMNAEL